MQNCLRIVQRLVGQSWMVLQFSVQPACTCTTGFSYNGKYHCGFFVLHRGFPWLYPTLAALLARVTGVFSYNLSTCTHHDVGFYVMSLNNCTHSVRVIIG